MAKDGVSPSIVGELLQNRTWLNDKQNDGFFTRISKTSRGYIIQFIFGG